MANSLKNICNDIEVCHPSLTKGKGKPTIMVSGASTGKTYHHFVNAPKEITVSGSISRHDNCFIVSF
jgi:hypothetical protein